MNICFESGLIFFSTLVRCYIIYDGAPISSAYKVSRGIQAAFEMLETTSSGISPRGMSWASQMGKLLKPRPRRVQFSFTLEILLSLCEMCPGEIARVRLAGDC